MIMQIQNSTIKDVDKILELYHTATKTQTDKLAATWPKFNKQFVELEIAEKRQWKILINNKIACVWAITFTDPQIWEDRDNEPSIYIHRISTNLKFRGNDLVKVIAKWAKGYAALNNKKFVRLDTVGENIGLINHYQKCGFDFLGLFKLKNTEGLPQHYHNATVSLFEIVV